MMIVISNDNMRTPVCWEKSARRRLAGKRARKLYTTNRFSSRSYLLGPTVLIDTSCGHLLTNLALICRWAIPEKAHRKHIASTSPAHSTAELTERIPWVAGMNSNHEFGHMRTLTKLMVARNEPAEDTAE